MSPQLIYIQPYDVAAGARINVRLASSLEGDAFGLGGFTWIPAIAGRAQISVETMAPDLSGRAQAGRARFSIDLAAAGISLSRSIKWGGSQLVIYSAKTLAWPGVLEFRGEITDQTYDPDTGILSITAEVSDSLIEKPLLTLEFDGSGGAGGDAEKRGVLKPAGFGSCTNIEPVMFDLTRNIGMIDGYGNCTAVTKVMEGLNDLGASVGDYANYAALASAIDTDVIPPGRWGTCIAEGLIGLGAPPTGVITVHATFGSDRLGAMMTRIMSTHAALSAGKIESSSFTALDAALNYPTHYWTDTQEDCKSLLERMARSGNATLVSTLQGKVAVPRATTSAAVATLDRSGAQAPRCIEWKPLAPMKPVWRLKARAARPSRVLSFDEVNYVDDIIDRGAWSNSTVYRAGNVVWTADKSSWLYTNPVATSGNALPTWPTTSNAYWTNLTPPLTATIIGVEPGADVTATHTAAAIAGQGAWATYGTLPPSRLEGLTNGQDVYIYKRSLTTPALPSATATITFATAVVTGLTNGWTTSIPPVDGNPLWISRAPAIGTGTTTTILSTAWDAPRAMADDKIRTFYAAGSVPPTATRTWLLTDTLPAGWTFTRSGDATRVNPSGYIENVAANLPRFDYDPVTGAAKGLMFEAGRTNIYPYSEDITTGTTAESASFSANTQTAPTNAATADTITASASNARHIGYYSFTGTAAVYAFSQFFKQGTARYVQLQLVSGGVRYGVILDTQTGTVTDVSSAGAPTGTSYRIETFKGGWYRLSITMTMAVTTCYAVTAISNSATPTYDASGNPTFNAAGTETIHLWGRQLEVGARATSYIPNLVGGSTARGTAAGEYAEITGTNFSDWFTSAQGTFYLDFDNTGDPAAWATGLAVFKDTTDQSVISLRAGGNVGPAFSDAAGASVAALLHGTPTAYASHKLAVAWAANDFASSYDGSAVLTDGAGTYGTGAVKMRLGLYGNGADQFTGHIRAASFWNTRLSNSVLQGVPGGTGPAPTAIGDIWVNTGEGNKQYRASSISPAIWNVVQDTAISTAQATADGKNKIFSASASAPTGAIAGDLWPDTSSSPTVVRRFDGVSTWTIIGTIGAQAGTNIFRTDGVTVLSQADIRTLEGVSSAISGQGALATLNTVGATQVNANAITAPYYTAVGVVTLSASSGFYQTITGLSFTANVASGDGLDVDLNLFLLWSGTDGTRFNVDAILLRDGSTVASFGTVMDTNDMATNNQGGFAIPANLSCRIDGNGASSTYSVQIQLSASVSESNGGGSKTFVAPLDIRVRQGVLRGRRFSR